MTSYGIKGLPPKILSEFGSLILFLFLCHYIHLLTHPKRLNFLLTSGYAKLKVWVPILSEIHCPHVVLKACPASSKWTLHFNAILSLIQQLHILKHTFIKSSDLFSCLLVYKGTLLILCMEDCLALYNPETDFSQPVDFLKMDIPCKNSPRWSVRPRRWLCH